MEEKAAYITAKGLPPREYNKDFYIIARYNRSKRGKSQ